MSKSTASTFSFSRMAMARSDVSAVSTLYSFLAKNRERMLRTASSSSTTRICAICTPPVWVHATTIPPFHQSRSLHARENESILGRRLSEQVLDALHQFVEVEGLVHERIGAAPGLKEFFPLLFRDGSRGEHQNLDTFRQFPCLLVLTDITSHLVAV